MSLLALLPAALGVAVGFAAGAPAPAQDPEKQVAEEAAPKPSVAEALQDEVRVDGEAPPAKSGEPAAEEGKPQAAGKRILTLDDLRDLPIMKRYEIPWEKGEKLLDDVKDNTFDYDESGFWYMVAKVSRILSPSLKPDADVTGYSQLMATPSAHRGKPVTIRGAYMSVTPFRTPVLAIRKDVPVLYECNLRELPLTETRPVATVVVMEDPMTYLEVFDEVRVKGYFYKVRKYEGSKGIGYAPMLVAQRLELEKRQSVLDTRSGMSSTQVQLALMVVVLAVLGGGFIWLRQRNKAKVNATGPSPVHRIRLRRPDRPSPFADGGPGDESGGPKP